MLFAFKALARSLVSFAGLVFGLACLVWLSVMREAEPQARGEWSGAAIHREASHEMGDESEPGDGLEVMPGLVQAEAGAGESLATLRMEDEALPLKRERPLVVVDAGHGGGDGGAVWNGIIEKNLALTLAQKLKAQLEDLGVDVVLTRSKDQFVSLERRAAHANRVRADVFVSLHLNSAGDESGVRGIETYFSTNKSLSAVRALQTSFQLPTTVGLRDRRGEKLATVVQRLVCQGTGASDRGTKERAYTVVHGASCPAILVECGFISNPKEAALLKTKAYQEKLAKGVARGISSFLQGQGIDPKRGIELPLPVEAKPPLKSALVKGELLSLK
jgi:N-acetylmuramoyl-L-alanine amidase